jgi:hypothetical protein
MPSDLPRFSTLKTGAQLVTRLYFPVSPRTIEKWPVAFQIINGRRSVKTAELIAHAESMIADAPPVMANSPLHHSRRKLRLVVNEPGNELGRPRQEPPRSDPPKVNIEHPRE